MDGSTGSTPRRVGSRLEALRPDHGVGQVHQCGHGQERGEVEHVMSPLSRVSEAFARPHQAEEQGEEGQAKRESRKLPR